jgi:hypothetical protein
MKFLNRDKPNIKRRGEYFVHVDDADEEPSDEPGLDANRRQQATVEQAAALLDMLLAGGPVAASDVRAAAWKFGISEGTLRRAKKQHGVASVREGNTWLWALSDEGAQQGAQDAQQGAQQDAHPDV